MLPSAAASLKRDREDEEHHERGEPRIKRFKEFWNSVNRPNAKAHCARLEDLASQWSSEGHELVLAQLCHELILIDPSYEYQLAGAFNPQHNNEDRLAAVRACTAVYRDLAESDSQFNRGLASLLDGLSSLLAQLGRKEEVVAVLRELMVICRDLARKGNAKLSIAGAFGYLSSRGCPEEAIAMLQEHVDHLRDLSQKNAAFQHPLICALEFQSTRLYELGHQEEALAVLRERFAVRHDVTTGNSGFPARLRNAFKNLFSRTMQLGREEEALAMLREHVTVLSDLAKDDPNSWWTVEAAFNHLLNHCRPSDVLVVLRERIAIYHNLAEVNPDAYCVQLDGAFEHLSDHFSDSGQQGEALAVLQDRVTALRGLVGVKGSLGNRERPLVRALKSLCTYLSKLGHKSHALAAADEAALLADRVINQTDSNFESVVTSLMSTTPSPSLYPNLQRYMLELSLSRMAVSNGNLLTFLPQRNRKDGGDRGSARIPLPAGLKSMSVTLHDEVAHGNPKEHSPCTTMCYHIPVEMLPRIYGHGHNISDQAHLLCHLQHHLSEHSWELAPPNIQSHLMLFNRTGNHHICLHPSFQKSQMPSIILPVLDLLQSCLTHCDQEARYLWTRQPQKILLLRVLQDACSATGSLPSLYRIHELPEVDWRHPLGTGAQSAVYPTKATTTDGERLAARVVHSGGNGWTSPTGQKILRMLQREIVMHWQLRHDNLLRLSGIFCDSEDEAPMMLVPLMKHGSAGKYLQMFQFGSAVQFTSVIHGASLGLDYLHSQQPPVVHGDIHDANILVDTNGQALLCDFGLSRIRHEVTRSNTSIQSGGKPAFTAPELSEQADPRPNEASDMYAFAMTILKLGTGLNPFEVEGLNALRVISAAQRGVRPSKPSTLGGLPAHLFAYLWSLVVRMWAHDPKARPAASEVVRVTKELVDATSH